MAELEDMINSVLNDPEQMSMISGLAKSLMGGGEEAAKPQSSAMPFDPGTLSRLQGLFGSAETASSKQEAMLKAMQPYLSEKRRNKMDKALKLARLARLAGFAMGELGGEKND